MWHGDWFGMPGNTLIIIFWLGVVIVLVAPFMRWLGSDRSPSSQLSSEPSVPAPLSILQERYAPGEINKEEFEEWRRILQDKQQSAAAGARYPIREISYVVITNI